MHSLGVADATCGATGSEISIRSSAAAVRAYIGRSWLKRENGGGGSYRGGEARSRMGVSMGPSRNLWAKGGVRVKVGRWERSG